MSDESLREFQLNGKQLVFLFMSSTIVAVVIFLCGVMVGRGVSAAQSSAVMNSTVETADPTIGALPDPTPLPPAAPPSDIAPEAPGDEPAVSYPETLTGDRRTADVSPPTSRPATPSLPPAPAAASTSARPSASTPASRTASTPAPKPTTTSASRSTSTSAPPTAAVKAPAQAVPAVRPVETEPAGTGFVVQVAATPRRSEADAIRGRLESKGYPAFVTTTGRLFRVRVGKYKDRGEATTVAKRLETQERFKPWVTR